MKAITRAIPSSVSVPLRRTTLLVLLSGSLLLGAWHGQAADFIDEFPTPLWASVVSGIASGSDGNLWYITGYGTAGSVTPQGEITELLIRVGSDLHGITPGPDGNLWFGETGGNVVVRLSPSRVFTEFATPLENSQPLDFAAGRDGNVWFTERGRSSIGRITPDGVVTDFPVPFPQYGPGTIAAGPDGNLWFTLQEAFAPNAVGRVTPAGAMTFFPLRSGVGPCDITAGPDGNVWFTEYLAGSIGRISPSGAITEFELPPGVGAPNLITTGPDGNLWVTTATMLVVMSPTGSRLREIALPPNLNGPSGITTGPDGNIWFTLPFARDPVFSIRSEVCRVNLAALDAPPAPALGAPGALGLMASLALGAVRLLRRA